ncbi:MetQ/NlpA family ABC transporter substrate-binding protein [Paenibacillus beijingensis]|uniref:Lipoprotein n=1 Tax=Paenibacillus beijingensis TaxID=1126833 RepID=A0A0D5NII3_9BACL|nr:MetQ/NlpA family ABC transporter substrate-binding protein [Paenibacillus beijingensis]AJY74723.1 methionine ABC transporter ATPase [Paenibacillus beijingensis]
MRKSITLLMMMALVLTVLAGCGGKDASQNGAASEGGSPEKKALKIGATAGPYSDMVSKAIAPILEKKGYTIEVVEFNDYVQPNKALANGSIDANLFQHVIYLQKFSADNKLDLKDVISVPTAPMGLYSNKFKSIDEIAEGSQLAVPNDPANLYRALLMLQDFGIVTLKKDADPSKISEQDIDQNPKKLVVKPLEAAQLPRTVGSTDLAVVPGNFALAAKMDLTSAVKLENMQEKYRNIVAVNTKDIDSQFAKDLKAAIESPEFVATIDDQFKGFSKPEWMTK